MHACGSKRDQTRESWQERLKDHLATLAVLFKRAFLFNLNSRKESQEMESMGGRHERPVSIAIVLAQIHARYAA